MRLYSPLVTFTFGMPTAVYQCVAVLPEHVTLSAATALPRETDTPQLRAAEQSGLFAYPYRPDPDSVKGHGA